MDFLWTKDIKPVSFPAINSDIETDVIIIGGGMAGILCAMRLENAGRDYILLEGEKIGHGITKGTTAVLTAQHDMLYQDMIKKFGAEKSKLYLEANLKAVKEFSSLAKKIECDFEEKPSVMYSTGNRLLMEREAQAVRSLGFNAEFETKINLPVEIAGAVVYPGMAQFHPLKFLYSMAEGLNIYENTFVRKIEGTCAITDKGKVKGKKIIIATHFPFLNKHGLYFMKLYQKRSYVIACKTSYSLDMTAEDIAENGFYMRNYKDLLLIGGGDHRTGKEGGGYKAVSDFAKKYFPDSKEVYRWSNQDCISLDGLPYIGQYSPSLPDVYTACGFNLWGMTTSMYASEILTDLVLGKENRYSRVFSTNRSMINPQLFSNFGNTFIDFCIPTTKRCSHLGCALKWNPAEHSWDCPCHGSRFTQSGEVIDNPAMKNIDF